MLKFWKKKDKEKDAETVSPPAERAVEHEVDTSSLEPGNEPLAEALSETGVTAETAPPDRSESISPQEPQQPQQRQPTPSWRQRLRGSGFAKGLSSVFTRHPKLDDALLDELETVLITADVGVTASTELVEDLRRRMHKREFADSDALLEALRQALTQRLEDIEQPLDVDTALPFVVLMVGVNGVGKTTTIGKLAHRLRDQGKQIMLAAGDTFRAAAVEQLTTWGERNNVPVMAQAQGADSASVIFDALQGARARRMEVLIADTAGRLHTQGGLMDELGKISRVLRKLDENAPHEVLMVIDGTTGQNAINQVRQFRQAVNVTGLVVTKLDGTAKGGVVFALAREFGLPIRFVGLGEQIEDLRPFDARAFVDGLLPKTMGA